MNFGNLIRQHWAALRALLALTVITGFLYPLIVSGESPASRTARQGGGLDHQRWRREGQSAAS